MLLLVLSNEVTVKMRIDTMNVNELVPVVWETIEINDAHYIVIPMKARISASVVFPQCSSFLWWPLYLPVSVGGFSFSIVSCLLASVTICSMNDTGIRRRKKSRTDSVTKRVRSLGRGGRNHWYSFQEPLSLQTNSLFLVFMKLGFDLILIIRSMVIIRIEIVTSSSSSSLRL